MTMANSETEVEPISGRCPDCKTPLLLIARKKAELLRLAEAGNLTATCPYHDRVLLTPEQQMDIAKNWHDPPLDP